MLNTQIKAIWSYRGFIWGSVQREFQARYRNSVLGSLWAILNPLSTILIYTVIFSQLMKARLPGLNDTLAYSIYLCAGILTWGLFAEIIGRCQTVFLENANMIKKLNFPRICLPVIVVLNAGVNFAISFGLFICFLLVLGKFHISVIWGLPLVLTIQVALAMGLGVILGILNVFFRDVGQAVGITMQLWFWFTPIVYPVSILPPSLQPIILLNPMAAAIGAYQSIILYGQWPQWSTLMPSAIIAAIACFIAIRLYRRHAGEMVDEI
jgi:lipopolysaccharide transport system permease protein